jgi:hypothetical protein
MYTLHTLHRISLLSRNIFKGRMLAVLKTRTTREPNVPLSFRIPFTQLQEIEDAVRAEARRHRTDLVEFIWNWAWSEYKKAGSLQALLGGTRTRRYSRRVSEELQDQLYIALGTILERAPSAVIDDVARTLTSRAGKYGSEK